MLWYDLILFSVCCLQGVYKKRGFQTSMLISIPNLIVNLARVNSTPSRNSGVTFSLPHRIHCHSLGAVVDRGSPGTAGYKKTSNNYNDYKIMKLNESLHSHSFILKRFVSCKLYAASNSNIQTYFQTTYFLGPTIVVEEFGMLSVPLDRPHLSLIRS